MNVNKLRAYEPLWDNWHICEDGLLREDSYSCVYRIQRMHLERMQYAALKVISIPKSQSEVLELQELGMSREEIQFYFYEIVREIYQKIIFISELKEKKNIIKYEDYKLTERPDEIGYDIFVRTELAHNSIEYTQCRDMTLESILKMGKDLCRGLQVYKKHNLVHGNIRPDTIFVSETMDFKFEDFEIAKGIAAYPVELSRKEAHHYVAPEIYFGKNYDHRADIYSLGIVLYFYLNQKRLPFLSQYSQQSTYKEQQEALEKRISGEEITFFNNAPACVEQVIQKAVAILPEERYDTIEEFYQAICRVEEAQKENRELTLDVEETIALEACSCAKKSDGIEEVTGCFEEDRVVTEIEPVVREKDKDSGVEKNRNSNFIRLFIIIVAIVCFIVAVRIR